MTTPVNAPVGCQWIGEYVDEGECPPELAIQRSEPVRTQVVANYIDYWGRDDGLREFIVLWKDGRRATVCGHGLKHEELPGVTLFSIVVRTGMEETVVAMFPHQQIDGIFQGELRTDGAASAV